MQARRTTLALALLALGLAATSTLLGCASRVGASARPATTQRADAARPQEALLARARLAERHEVGAAEQRRLVELQVSLDAAVEEGRTALLAGNSEAAFGHFDRALDLVMRTELDIDANPAFRAHVEQVLAEMNELALREAGENEALDEDGTRLADLPGDIESLAPAVAVHHLPPPDAPFTIPFHDHSSVDAMINFYSGRVKDRFEVGIQRFGLYAPTVQRILAEEGVPPDLIWLAMVESNYNAQAYSRAHARGLWQFIPGTGRKFGLKQDFWVDERSDFEKSTRSAARYLKELHGMFGDWHLAIAAYNAGEGKIGRAIRSTGRKDFWHIRQTRYIRTETKNYVPAFLAVMAIMRNPSAHGVNYAPQPAMQWDTVEVRGATDLSVLAQCAGTTTEILSQLNGELRRGMTPGHGEPYSLRVPRGSKAQFAEKYAALPAEQKLAWQRHVVRSGETVASIAERYGASTAGILAANRLSSASKLQTGRTLMVPQGPAFDSAQADRIASLTTGWSVEDERDRSSSTARRTYRVRPGDTLSSIARRHGVSVAKLTQWNGLRNSHRIRVGQRLTIRGGSSSSTASASASRSSGSSASSPAASSGSGRTTHVVRPGDTLSEIAAAHGTTVANLRAWNKMSRRNTIYPGEKITIMK